MIAARIGVYAGTVAVSAAFAAITVAGTPAIAQETRLCGMPDDPEALDALLDGIVSIDHGAWYVRYLNGYALIGPRPIVAEPEPREDGGFLMSRSGSSGLSGRPAAGAEPSPEPPGWRPIPGPASMTVAFEFAESDDPLPRLKSVETDDGVRIDPPFTLSGIEAQSGCAPRDLPRLIGRASGLPGAITDINLIMTSSERMVGLVRDSAPAQDVDFFYHVELTPAVDPPLRDDPLTVVETQPSMERENVDFDTPPITVEFSEPVVAETMSDAFTLETRAPGGQRISIAGTVTGGGTTFTFRPDEQLDPGVRYRATVEGGADGVEGVDGAVLEADHWWDFFTVVDLGTQADENDRFSLDVYQTTRNAPLVPGKRTMTRMSVNWTLHEHIEPGWQVDAFPAEVDLMPAHRRVQDQFGEWHDIQDDTVLRVRHPDEVATEQHRRMARTTLNYYGWQPGGDGAVDLAMELTPHDVYPAPRPDLSWDFNREAPMWQGTPQDPLTLHWVTLKVGTWSDSLDMTDLGRLNGILNDASDFTTQVFPVLGTAASPLGPYTPGDTVSTLLDDAEGVTDAIQQAFSDIEDSEWSIGPDAIVRRMLLRLGRHFAGQIGPNDVLVAFHPLNFLDHGLAVSGVQVRPEDADSGFDRRVVRMPLDANMSPAVAIEREALAHGLVHELTHVYGLHHYPGHMSEITPRDEMGEFDGIEGFRIRRDGLEGWNKSSTDGNQEHGQLFPVMFPAIRPLDRVFILDDHYDHLLNAFAGTGTVIESGGIDRAPPAWPSLFSTAYAESGPAETSSLMISGALHPDGSGAVIESTHWLDHDATDENPDDSGDYTAELRDSAGTVIAVSHFRPEPPLVENQAARDRLAEAGLNVDEPFWWAQFSVRIADDANAHDVVIRRGNDVLTTTDVPRNYYR